MAAEVAKKGEVAAELAGAEEELGQIAKTLAESEERLGVLRTRRQELDAGRPPPAA